MTPKERKVMQMALQELEKLCNTFSYPPDSLYDIINALRAALAAPPQELDLPKVQLWEFLKLIEGKEDFRGIPLMRTEWPTQGEALAQPPCATGAQCVGNKCERCAVQEREWIGLTSEERLALWSGLECDLECLKPAQYAEAIEAKLREKNFDRPS